MQKPVFLQANFMIGWFYGMSTHVGFLNVEDSLFCKQLYGWLVLWHIHSCRVIKCRSQSFFFKQSYSWLVLWLVLWHVNTGLVIKYMSQSFYQAII